MITVANSMVSPSQCNGCIVETNSQKSEKTSTPAIVEEPLHNHKQDVVQQQQSNSPTDLAVSQDESPTSAKIETIESMAEAKSANGSKIETTLNSCDKDYNEEKEFQRASKVATNTSLKIELFLFICTCICS